MAPKKPTVKTRLQQKADKSNKILTGPKGSKPQSTTNARLMKQGDKTTKSGNYTVGRTEYNNGRLTNAAKPDGTMKRNRRGSGAKGTPSTPSGGGKNLFGGAGDKNTAVKQAGPKAPKPAFKPAKTPFSSPPAVGQTARDLAKAQGQAAVKNAQQRRANLARVQQDLRGQVGRAASLFSGPAGKARQAIVESVAPRPTSTRANLKEGMAAAKATMKAKAKSADSFGGQYQKPKAGAKPKPAPKMSKAKSFDNAFASARNSGMKTFVWEGKRYNTKMRGEK
jgi:hypothetical protein